MIGIHSRYCSLTATIEKTSVFAYKLIVFLLVCYGLSSTPVFAQQLTGPQVAAAAYDAGFSGSSLVYAVAIAGAESTWVLDAMHSNTNGSVDYGLWQINSSHGYVASELTSNASYNAMAAYQIYSNPAGSGWKQWATYYRLSHYLDPNFEGDGPYLKWLARAISASSSVDPTVVHAVGDTVEATEDGLSIYHTPGGKSDPQTRDSGDSGVVTDTYQTAQINGAGKTWIWWKIKWSDGKEGWSVQDYLQRTEPVPSYKWLSRSSGTNNALYAIVNGNGKYVAVGANGTILTSPDGVAWKPRHSRTTQNLQAVTYGNGLFVAGGSSGTILTSPDAINWTSQNGAFDYNSYTQLYDNVYTLSFGNGLFGLSGQSALIQTSPNGTSWTAQGTFGLANLYGSTYANGSFVFSGYLNPSTGGTTGIVVTSLDGVHWIQTAVGAYALHSLAYGNGSFVAVGDSGTIDSSATGINWTAQGSNTMAQLLGITYGNGFVAVGANGTILASTNGTSWNSSISGVANNLNGLAYANGTFVVVGDNGTILQSHRAPSALGFLSR